MNREIKFRVWDNQYNRMLDWDEICNSKFNILTEVNVEMSLIEFLLKYQPNKNMLIQHFTGLKDKDGKEIYEGDILKENHFPFHADAVFWASSKDGYDFDGWLCKHFIPSEGYGEIIGNIYENLELLKK